LKIHKLTQDVANKIAAGEVVERPASCVKELVENSIDAGAGEILVEISSGGLELIRVSDNGCGMEHDDAVLAFERHATSKISGADDLFKITSLGFRGEALPSIASVSNVTLITCSNANDAASLIEISAGSIVQISNTGAPVGTTIEIRDLFFNTPARLKYLSSSKAETRRVVDIMSKLALSRPDISFRLNVDDKFVFSTSGSGDLLDAAAQVMGIELARKMIAVSKEFGEMSISGLIAHPDKAKTGRNDQYFSVNGRPFVSKTAWIAADKAADRLIPQGKHLPLVLNVEIDPSLVDVNVHPTKSEVRFYDDKQFYSLVYSAVSSALSSYEVMPDLNLNSSLSYGDFQRNEHADSDGLNGKNVSSCSEKEPDYQQTRQSSFSDDSNFDDMKAMFRTDDNDNVFKGFANELKTQVFKKSAENEFKINWSEIVKEEIERENEYKLQKEALNGNDPSIDLSSLNVIGQLSNMYILVEHKGGLLIVDQHVAHERVLVDLFRKRALEREVEVQLLLTPKLIDLPPRLCIVAMEFKNQLDQMGFQFDQFSGNSVLLRGVPMMPESNTSPDQLFKETLEELDEVPKASNEKVIYDKIIISASCKAAIKAGALLNINQMTKLISDLFKSSAPFTCPHGRPVILNISNEKLGKSFKRI